MGVLCSRAGVEGCAVDHGLELENPVLRAVWILLTNLVPQGATTSAWVDVMEPHGSFQSVDCKMFSFRFPFHDTKRIGALEVVGGELRAHFGPPLSFAYSPFEEKCHG